MTIAERTSFRYSSGDSEGMGSSGIVTVLLLDEPEWYDRGLVKVPDEDCKPIVVISSRPRERIGLVSARPKLGFRGPVLVSELDCRLARGCCVEGI